MKQLVCHYTFIESFQKMIEKISQDGEEYFLTFWATSIYALNDPSEFLHGYKLLKDSVLPEIEKELGITEQNLTLSHIWDKVIGEKTSIDKLDYMIRHIYDSHETPFIVSFSKKIDFLPMWNAYSDRGKGVCLCFNNEEYLVKDNEPDILHKLHAMDVTYGKIDDDIRKVFKKLYKDYYLQYKEIPNAQQQIQIMLNYLIALIVVFSAYHKHEAYAYEDESRLVQYKHDNKDINYRLGMKGQLKPYIEVKVKLEYLEKIIVGPCADSELVIRELKNQLRQYNITDIEPSRVPFRAI